MFNHAGSGYLALGKGTNQLIRAEIGVPSDVPPTIRVQLALAIACDNTENFTMEKFTSIFVLFCLLASIFLKILIIDLTLRDMAARRCCRPHMAPVRLR